MKEHRTLYAVIVDVERYPAKLGRNEIMAIFRHKEHAEKYGSQMWEEYYLIQEIEAHEEGELEYYFDV